MVRGNSLKDVCRQNEPIWVIVPTGAGLDIFQIPKESASGLCDFYVRYTQNVHKHVHRYMNTIATGHNQEQGS